MERWLNDVDMEPVAGVEGQPRLVVLPNPDSRKKAYFFENRAFSVRTETVNNHRVTDLFCCGNRYACSDRGNNRFPADLNCLGRRDNPCDHLVDLASLRFHNALRAMKLICRQLATEGLMNQRMFQGEVERVINHVLAVYTPRLPEQGRARYITAIFKRRVAGWRFITRNFEGGWPWGVVRAADPPNMVEEMLNERTRGPELDLALALCRADFMEDANTVADSGSDEPGSPGDQHQDPPLQEVPQQEVPPVVQPAPVRENAPIEPIRNLLPQVAQEHGNALFALARAQNGLNNRRMVLVLGEDGVIRFEFE
jgi:hypothetical protein